MIKEQNNVIDRFGERGEGQQFHRDIGHPVLHGVSEFERPPWGAVWGTQNVAVCFYERSTMSDEAVKNANTYDLVLTGTTVAWLPYANV